MASTVDFTNPERVPQAVHCRLQTSATLYPHESTISLIIGFLLVSSHNDWKMECPLSNRCKTGSNPATLPAFITIIMLKLDSQLEVNR